MRARTLGAVIKILKVEGEQKRDLIVSQSSSVSRGQRTKAVIAINTPESDQSIRLAVVRCHLAALMRRADRMTDRLF